jgi:thiamine biosynthesis lipoprotein
MTMVKSKRIFHCRLWITVFIAFFISGSPVCFGQKQELLISGKTMGTTYHVKIIAAQLIDFSGLEAEIASRLNDINQLMSIFIADSELSRFNAFKTVGKKFLVSRDLFAVLSTAARLHALTQGAWDGTIQPLVDLWGFGRTKIAPHIPEIKEIQALMAQVGFDKIEIIAPSYLKKKMPSVSLDLGSIAKGFGVDQIAKLLSDHGFKNYLVEIGGEVYAAGRRKDKQPWRVGINTPRKDAPFNQVYKVVALKDYALATSGNYRNFFEIDGRRYAHVLNPRTGSPVANGIISVSVLADNCTFADGLATAIMVMGAQPGLALVNQLPGVESLIIVEEPDGKWSEYASHGFKRIE